MEKLKKAKEKLNINKINNIINTGNKILKILYFLLIFLALYIIILIFKEWKILSFILGILKIISPLFIGFVIAWLLNPIVNKLTNGGMKRTPAVILIFSMMVLFLYFACLLLIPILSNQINDIVSAIPNLINETKIFVSGIFDKLSNASLTNLDSIKENFFEKINIIGKDLMTNLPETFFNIIKSLISTLGTILISFVIGFYMLLKFDKLSDKILKLFPKENRSNYSKLITDISVNLYEYVNGTLLVSFIIFVVNSLGFMIIGVKAPILFGLFCGITNLIPYVGPYIGGAPVVLIAFSESPVIGIITLIFIAVVQTLEGTFITPMVMSKKMNLSPITIIIMLLIFGYLFGIIGMILATPAAALIKIIYIFLDEKYKFFNYENEDKEKSKI